MLELAAAALLGGLSGFGAHWGYRRLAAKRARQTVATIIEEAKAEARRIEREAKDAMAAAAAEQRREERERRQELKGLEAGLERRQSALDVKFEDLDRRGERLRRQEAELDALKEELRGMRGRQLEKLEKIAALTRQEARERLLRTTEKDVKGDMLGLVEKLQRTAQEEAEDRARLIVLTAMERLASEPTAERTITTVPLSSDEMKGRVIGKEGRNIQAFERLTGVDVIIDETPGAIVLSSFDPVRRQVARIALEKLVADGRIHPGRIEEVIAKAQAEVDREARKAGEAAAKATGVVGLPADIVQLLGQLTFRTSFSQNVLKHSVEMTHLAGMIAREVGADVRISKTAALLHDIGKAVTHEVEGKHHHIGRQIAEAAGLEEAICHAIEAHHDDIEATTPEALVVRVVDAISASRPGARGDTLENYARRMTELENIAATFPAVGKSYAISAGREIRVIVRPEAIDDLGALRLARDIADKIQSTLRYPGTIKVNVIRETRATEYAK